MPLTDIQTKQAKPQDKPYKLSDEKNLSLGAYPETSLKRPGTKEMKLESN